MNMVPSLSREVVPPTPWALPFGLPVGDLDERVLAALAGTRGQGLVDALITATGDEIESSSRGLVELLGAWSHGQRPFEPAWDIAFGRIEQALTVGGLNVCEVATRVGLRLTETGTEGAWEAEVPVMTAQVGGLMLEAIERVQVDGSPKRRTVTVRRSDGTAVTCRRQGAGQWEAPGAPRLAVVGVRRSIHLLAASQLPSADGGPQGFDGVQPVASIDDSMVQTFQRAFEILREGAPDYLSWVERVLRAILVCERPESSWIVSGSASMLPGVVHVSYPAEAMDIADALVHECAHQHFYLLEHVGPFDDGSDERLYWSPPVRRDRPLSKILMAYHAFANVRLFYEAVRASGVDEEGYVKRHEQRLTDTVAQLDAPLRANRTLTDLGRTLYYPLATRVAALRP